MSSPTPTINGIPVRLPAGYDFMSKGIDEWREELVEGEESRVRIFNLADAAQLAQYEDVFKQQDRGQATVYREDMHWIEKDQTWHVMLRYGINFWELPPR